MKKTTGILLINLGTPNSTETRDVRVYLREFLSDPRVIDLPTPIRWLIVNAFILPFRPKQSAKAYKKIWRKQGSPLLIYGQQLRDGLNTFFEHDIPISLGMRYGKPSIQEAYENLLKQKCNEILILPLFPQYSSAATGSAIEKCLEIAKKFNNIPTLKVIHEFYQESFFIDSLADIIESELKDINADHILFSYHGLPERHIEKSGCAKSFCDRQNVCPSINADNHFCYRAQCFATTEKIMQQLPLVKQNFSTSFQSRLGRTPWIKPYTDEVLPELAQKGVRNLAIVCPAFVADCLETLEEIGMQAREQWQTLGGEEFKLIPCLNATEIWVKRLGSFLAERFSD